MSDALADISENRLDAAPGDTMDRTDLADLHGKHRGTVAADDTEGRREPAGHGRHSRASVTAD
jgi:hypothetical protein